jgi:hypothetical protein
MTNSFKITSLGALLAMLSACGTQKACPCMDPAVATGAAKAAEPMACDGKAAPAEDGVLDDFEDDDTQVVKLDGRDGYWWSNADKEGSKFTDPPPGTGLKWMEGGANGSKKALHVAGATHKGSDQAYGIEVGTNLISTKGSLYDASKYMGVSFWAKVGPKSIKKVRVNFPDIDTHPDLGSCKNCWNHFMKEVELTTEWQEYQISFKELAQRAGWGEPRPKSVQPNQLYAFTFAMEGGGDFELWVDDINFLQCKK